MNMVWKSGKGSEEKHLGIVILLLYERIRSRSWGSRLPKKCRLLC
jgi:hypothetical protein